jgi:hypothetical protein
MIPRSAAWDSRKRKSIDWAFSEFRACGHGKLSSKEMEGGALTYHDCGYNPEVILCALEGIAIEMGVVEVEAEVLKKLRRKSPLAQICRVPKRRRRVSLDSSHIHNLAVKKTST